MDLSVHEAAERLGVSEATIRRRIRRGDLRAIKHALPSGYEWRVLLDDHPAVTASDQGVTLIADSAVTNDHPVHAQDTPQQHTDDHPAVTILDQGVVTTAESTITNDQPAVMPPDVMHLVERLYTENVQLAGQVGFYQARIQALEEQVKLLTDTQHASEQPVPEAEPTPQAADQPAKRVPWWRRLFGQ